MGEKNESIFLWMLEQERQKSRAFAVELAAHDSAAQLPSILDTLLSNGEESSKHEDESPTVDETTELDQLMKEAKSLEEESHRLTDEEKQFSLRAKMLCERAIQELKKKNGEKQQEVTRLKEEISNLETQLHDLSSSDSQGESRAGTIENLNKTASKVARKELSRSD